MKGIENLCRFAYVPNIKGQCGLPGDHRVFSRYLVNPTDTNRQKVLETIKGFPSVMAYTGLISEYTGLPPDSDEVLNAYMLGGRLLNAVPLSSLSTLVVKFREMLGEDNLKKVLGQIRPGMVPHHNFNVLFVDGAALDDHLRSSDHRKKQFISRNISNCMVQPGFVSYRNDKGVVVDTSELYMNGEFTLVHRQVMFTFNQATSRLRKGDYVALHGRPFAIITEEQHKELQEMNERFIKMKN